MEPAPRSRFIVRGGIYGVHREAHMILADARAAAVRMRAELDAERRGVLEAAREEGLRQGISEAAPIVADVAIAIDAFWRERESELAEVGFAIAHRILGSVPADEVLARLASEAIAEHAASVKLTLRAGPEAAAYLRAALKDLGHDHRVTVLADPAVAPGECNLSHKHGRANLGLLAQFRAMMNGLPGHQPEAEPQG